MKLSDITVRTWGVLSLAIAVGGVMVGGLVSGWFGIGNERNGGVVTSQPPPVTASRDGNTNTKPAGHSGSRRPLNKRPAIRSAITSCLRSFAYPPTADGPNNSVENAAGPLASGETYQLALNTNPNPPGSDDFEAWYGFCPRRAIRVKIRMGIQPASCSSAYLTLTDGNGEVLTQAHPDPTAGTGDDLGYFVKPTERYLLDISSCQGIKYSLDIEPPDAAASSP
jgi:hypothetical protein